MNKISAYALQDDGLDTVEANRALGFRDDERDYGVAAHMLRLLEFGSIQIITNNPRKIAGLEEQGIRIAGRIPLVVPPNEHNVFYLSTKARRSGHWIDLAGYEHLAEQHDRPIVDGMRPSAIAELEGQRTAPPEPVVVVTGAAGGLGTVVSHELASAGWRWPSSGRGGRPCRASARRSEFLKTDGWRWTPTSVKPMRQRRRSPRSWTDSPGWMPSYT